MGKRINALRREVLQGSHSEKKEIQWMLQSYVITSEEAEELLMELGEDDFIVTSDRKIEER